jgi:hypothetical protein
MVEKNEVSELSYKKLLLRRIRGLFPTLDQLAEIMEPMNSGNAFAPINAEEKGRIRSTLKSKEASKQFFASKFFR